MKNSGKIAITAGSFTTVGLLYILFKHPGMFWRALVAGTLSTLLDLGVANVVTYLFDAPEEYAPFTFLPILSGGMGGALGGAGVYTLLLRFNRQPEKAFRYTALLVLLGSYYLPTRLLVTKSSRFAGANLPIILTQMIMHTLVAVTTVAVLTRQSEEV